MTKFFTLVILLLPFFNSYAQSCSSNKCVTFYGNSASGYQQAFINNADPSSPVTNSEVLAFTWTNDSHNVPLYNGRTAFRFDLSSIPSNAIITSAKLSMFPDNNSGSGVNGQPTYGSNNAAFLQRIIHSWDPNSTTWNNPPVVTTINQKILAQSSSTSQMYIVDLTDLTQVWVNKPDSNYGVLLRMQTENNPYNSLIFFSGDNSVPDAQKLKLDVCYRIMDSKFNQLAILAGDEKFKQLAINDNYPSIGDSNQTELDVFTWTNNTHDFPQFNGRDLLKYDLTSIPANAAIYSAKLYLFAKTNSTSGVAGQPTYGSNNAALLQKVVTDWQLNNTSWNHQPAVSAIGQKLLPQSTNTAQNYIVDVTDFVKLWVSKPDSNFGALLRMQTEYNPYNSLLFESKFAPDSLKARIEICYGLSSVLPIKLSKFEGALTNQKVTLTWSTYNEINSSNIIVERSLNGKDYVNVSSLPAKGSDNYNNYQFTDDYLPPSALKVYYRLKFVNNDGSYTYSNVLLFSSLKNTIGLELFPNPASQHVQLTFSSEYQEATKIDIIDASGKKVTTQPIKINKGINSVTVDGLNKLRTGMYFIQVVINGEKVTRKLIIN